MYCGQCGKEIPDNSKFCNECGYPVTEQNEQQTVEKEVVKNTSSTKNFKTRKKFKLWHFAIAVIAVIILVVAIIFTINLIPEKFNWNDVLLKSALPEPESNYGHIDNNDADDLRLTVDKISFSQYEKYVQDCIAKGFTYIVESDANSYNAFNDNSYELELDYDEDDQSLDVSIDVRVPGIIKWSNSELAASIPIPKSNTGSILWDYTYGYEAYVGNTSKEDYNTYISECESMGYNLSVQKQEDSFYAKNNLGYELIVEYFGCDLIHIDLEVPEDSEEDEESNKNNTSTTAKDTNNNNSSNEDKEDSPSSNENVTAEDDNNSTTVLEPYDGAVKVCQKIKDSLNNPDSLQLHEILHVTYNGCDYYYIDLSAMNKMGGYTRTRYYAMFMDGVLFKLEEMESFSYEDIINSKFDDLEYLEISTVEYRLK